MGVYSTEELEEIKAASLKDLGVILMDKLDGILADRPPEDINDAYGVIGSEVIRRVDSDADKLEVLLDFHYDKWKRLSKRDSHNRDDSRNAFYEFKALMAGFTKIHSEEPQLGYGSYYGGD